MSLLYHVNMYLEFLILACTIYILAPSILLQFSDIWGKQKVSNPNFKEGVNPHIWTDSGKSDWYVFRPGAAEYQKVADTLENYMSVFQDMVMAQAEQDCTIQMGT